MRFLSITLLISLSFSAIASEVLLKTKIIPSPEGLYLRFSVNNKTGVTISHPNDLINLWNHDDRGYKYYIIGNPYKNRLNLWVGVGHAQNTGKDYLMVTLRNLNKQFGLYYPRDLVMNFKLNTRVNPGVVEDGGFNIYPLRRIENPGMAGIDEITAEATPYIMGNNNFKLRLNLENNFYDLKSFSPKHIVIYADGDIGVKLPRP